MSAVAAPARTGVAHASMPAGPPPYRDARYAPRALEVERRGDGTLVLFNPRPYAAAWTRTFDALAHWAAVAPDDVWLTERSGEGRRALAYGEGAQQVRAIAGGLLDLGVEPGRSLLILARNDIDHALVAYAAMAVGIAASPVSPQYGLPGADLGRLAHAVELLRPAAVFVEDAALFGEALVLPGLKGLPVIAGRNARTADIAFDTLLRRAGPAQAAFDAVRPDQAAKHLLTSGSTGAPKAVICTHANIALNGAQIAACYSPDAEPPVVVNGAPWSHSLGGNALLHGTTHQGGTLHIDRGQPTPERFGETLATLRAVEPTYHNMVPAGWPLLAEALERDPELARRYFGRLRILQYGGAGLAQSTADRITDLALATVGERITFAAGYGATETGPTVCNIHWPNDRTGIIGLPVPGTAVKLVPAPGGKQELRVRGPQVSPGYLDGAELSAQAFDEEGFYRLGDAARLVDPENPEAGLAFDGRLAETFKLATGAFVSAGALRVAALSAIGPAARDAIVCGEGRDGVGLLLFLHEGWTPESALEPVRTGLLSFNAEARGSAGRIARALILPDAPDPASGELTDKGYINQALARARRARAVARLFAAEPDPEVIVL